MGQKRQICIADDHEILRAGLRSLLAPNPELEIVAEVADGFELLSALQKFQPELVLIDLGMPRLHGLDAIREIRRRQPDTKILVLTMHDSEEYVRAALEAGVQGYLLKDSSYGELVQGVIAVLAGKVYLSPAVSGGIVRGYLAGQKTDLPRSGLELLTHREREVLKLIAEGHTNAQIAKLFHCSVKTIETHRANLMKKLDLHNAAGLTSFAISQGLAVRKN